MTMQEAVIKNIDTDYSYQLAKRMEQFRSNEKLGYRPAGSKAEFLTGEMLKDEMQKLGLSDVCKNAVTVDGWEFKNAELTFETKEGKRSLILNMKSMMDIIIFMIIREADGGKMRQTKCF